MSVPDGAVLKKKNIGLLKILIYWEKEAISDCPTSAAHWAHKLCPQKRNLDERVSSCQCRAGFRNENLGQVLKIKEFSQWLIYTAE